MSTKIEQCEDIVVRGWHLKKEVTIGQLITMFALIVSGLWWASSVETRMGNLVAEDRRIEQKHDILMQGMSDRFDRYQAAIADALNEIKSGISRVEDKIDKKADK